MAKSKPTQPPADAAEEEVAATVEAIVFASDRPLPAAKVAQIGQLGTVRHVRRAIAALNDRYEQTGRAFRIVEIAGGYQFQTLPQYHDVLEQLHKSRSDSRLSQAAMETLAIVAYRQPVLRANVEAIRGVACGDVLRGLMEKNLVRITGRAQEIGRPMLYGTTRRFLEVFGLAGLEDLPNAEQLKLPALQAAMQTPGQADNGVARPPDAAQTPGHADDGVARPPDEPAADQPAEANPPPPEAAT